MVTTRPFPKVFQKYDFTHGQHHVLISKGEMISGKKTNKQVINKALASSSSKKCPFIYLYPYYVTECEGRFPYLPVVTLLASFPDPIIFNVNILTDWQMFWRLWRKCKWCDCKQEGSKQSCIVLYSSGSIGLLLVLRDKIKTFDEDKIQLIVCACSLLYWNIKAMNGELQYEMSMYIEYR